LSPLRLLIIAGLIYLIYRLLTRRGSRAGAALRDEKAPENSPVRDVLVEDPVCHTLIPRRQAINLYHGQQMYHFCSQQCCETFLGTKGEGK